MEAASSRFIASQYKVNHKVNPVAICLQFMKRLEAASTICYNCGMSPVHEPPAYYCRFAETAVGRANLPHWHQRCATFLTFRLADSLPQEKLALLEEEKDAWLNAHPKPWDEADALAYKSHFGKAMQKWLDAGYGTCVLKDKAIRLLVEDALRHFDGIRYSLYAYVVMPNHVHVLFMPREGFEIADIVHSWKSFTGTGINHLLGRTGTLWQKESFDHLVRNATEFSAIRNYIRVNAPELAYDAYAT